MDTSFHIHVFFHDAYLLNCSYFSIADELSADIDVAGVVSRMKPLNRSPNVPCRPSECHKCPAIIDLPAK